MIATREESESQPDPSVANLWAAPIEKKKKGQILDSKRLQSWNKFKSKSYGRSFGSSQQIHFARKNRTSSEDYTEVFLCHARLYVFADKYHIGALKLFALYKLYCTLVEFNLYDERTEDVISLIGYACSNTADIPERIDELRDLLAQYSACVVEKLAGSANFSLLVEEPGPFAKDLFRQLLKRLD